jgi:Sulfatase
MRIHTRWLLGRAFLVCLAVGALQLGGPLRAQTLPGRTKSAPPNILFIILDDVGIDVLASFNPASPTAALTPNINAVIAAGVKFTKFYTMPECSPSRAAFFTGRFAFRTGVNAAILADDLPAAQVSPFEMTTPRVLSKAGYQSALIGKYHLGGPENNPDGNDAPVALGWDYFNGNMRGGPPGIDVSLGGQYTKDTSKYASGFPIGAQLGVSWFQGTDGQGRCTDNKGAGYTGQQAVALGGIPALNAAGTFAATCAEAQGSGPNFTIFNGYYVWPQVIANASGVQTMTSRQYMTTAQTGAAIEWIRAQQKDLGTHPWMVTVAYNSIHTPYQEPPMDLYPPGFVWPSNVPENAQTSAALPILGHLMLAAADVEVGRLLVGAGLAKWDAQGQLVYQPAASNTMIVIVGDNGTYLPSVEPPYDPIRAKGTPYETGVLAPLIVAGPLVAAPGRSVDQLVNSVDLFQLFGEIAGLDVHTIVPSAHVLDSVSVLPYLTNPNQGSLRQYNFTQLGPGLKPSSVQLWPCVVSAGGVSLASDILFTSQNECEDAGGKWFGPTTDQPIPLYPTSCAVQAAGLYTNLSILPTSVWALRNTRYKLVQVDRASCDLSLGEFEFYDLAPNPPSNPLGLDLATTNLLTNGQPVNLQPEQAANFWELRFELQTELGSEPVCYGDGNLDKLVNSEDALGVLSYWGQPSVFNFEENGVTGNQDLQWVWHNFGNDCLRDGPGSKPN